MFLSDRRNNRIQLLHVIHGKLVPGPTMDTHSQPSVATGSVSSGSTNHVLVTVVQDLQFFESEDPNPQIWKANCIL